MTASTYEYKTVALPQTVQGKRRRGVSEADLVAETLGELIHLEAVDGWEYLRSDIMAAGTRGGMFSKEMRVTYYSVLVFRRVLEGVWPTDQAMPAPARSAPDNAPHPVSTPAATPASTTISPVKPAPAAKTAPPPRVAPAPIAAPAPRAEPVVSSPAIDDPTSPLSQGAILSTGGRIQTDRGVQPPASPVVKPTPRPPLGSAQD